MEKVSEDEIEITPEMIEAGRNILIRSQPHLLTRSIGLSKFLEL